MHTAAEQVANVGLSTIEAAARLREYGRNELPEPPSPTLVRRLARSLRDPLVLVLLTALGLTILVGDLTDAAVIALVVVVNSGIGLRQDVKADQMVRALARLAATRAWVIRSGQPNEVPVAEIVPGDLLMLRRGDLVPADAVLVEGSGVQVDESMLTGESVPVDRFATTDPGPDRMPRVPPVPGAGAQPADDLARLLSGTVVLHGHGLARVTATGTAGAVGRLAALMVTVPAATPLQRRMARLSAQLAVAAVALSVVVLGIGLAQGQPLERMVLATIALVVAAVPESLPLVVTVSLAMAARRMAAQHALVRNLSAVETLGSVTLLATDKTGTLTQGSMAVAETWHPASVSTEDLMRALVLCNDAAVDPASGRSHGDPTENALLAVAQASGLDAEALRTAYPRIGEAPFDSTRKAMTTIHRDPLGNRLVVRKGAPEVLLAPGSVVGSAAVVEEARSRAESWARRGIRVIAVAEVHGPSGDSEIASEGARLLGLVGLVDPIRDTSAQTVADCRAAGLRVVLITGDHPSTADAVAAEVGIGDGAPAVALATETDPRPDVGGDVIARATPADKYALVRAYQAAGHVVAMTGDGVNDAPALRAADIGVAMGERGTEVARQAADLVLADDNLGTLVAAVEEGRRVYANIRRFLVYGLAGGCSEVLLMLAGPAINVPLPLLPAQILWLNLLTHSFAGAGLAVQPGDALALGRGPRPPTQGPLAAGLWWRTLVIAAYLAAVSLVALWASPVQPAQSAALLTLGAGQLAVAWGVRTARPTFWRPGDRVDPLIPALFTAGAMLIASITVGPLRDLLGTQPVDAATWARAGAAAVGAWALTRALRTRSL
jgi:Ca2+-transporting ATPase